MTVVVAIVGATGAVGKEMIKCLQFVEKFSIDTLHLFASDKSAGIIMDTYLGKINVETFSIEAVIASKSNIVLMAVNGDFSLKFSPILAKAGCIIIDNSSAFRYMDNVPLVVPEINLNAIQDDDNIIANPNCTSAILAMAIWPIHRQFEIKKIIASTYQAASGAGEQGMAELDLAIRAYADGRAFDPVVFSHNLCVNVIPCIDTVQENGYTREEMKMVWETRKIFNNTNDLLISCTAVRVPTMRAHCISATVQVGREITVEEVRELIRNSPGVELMDDAQNGVFPVPSLASGQDNVFVGRIRENLIFGNFGSDLFICGDQLLRGAALNAVKIASEVVRKRGL